MNEKQKNLCKLFGIKLPIIQAGMVWVSGAKLAAAATNSGVLGIIGAGSMKPDLLAKHLKKAKSLTTGSLGVNLPLLYDKIEEQINICLSHDIRIFITSAGSPKKFTKFLKDRNCVVAHVTSSPSLAVKCQDAGVDAVIAEGFEAGGHNGRDEITTMSLIPQVVESVKIPVIAAGGIANGSQIAAALSLGAAGVQIGTRFVATKESSAHENFLQAILKAAPGDTELLMKNLVPVRLLNNEFAEAVRKLEKNSGDKEDLALLLGKGRAKKGMLEGDIVEGELEIGQVSAMIQDVPSCKDLVERLVKEYNQTITGLKTF